MPSHSSHQESNGKIKDRQRHNSESENDPKRSKFNLKLERVSPNGNKTLSAAGASLKWLFSRKKSKGNKEGSGSVSSSTSSFINPIPIVAAASGEHVANFSASPEPEEEMSEKIDPDGESDNNREDLMSTCLNHCGNGSQPHFQRIVQVPKVLPQDRIAYGFNHDPRLQNFHLQGNQHGYPNKKLIFRPSSYPNGPPPQINQYNNNSYNNQQFAPRGPVLAHIRGPFPPPRLVHSNHNHNHSSNPFPRPPAPRSPRGPPPRNNCPHPPYQNNFPHNHNPNPARQQPLSANGFANHIHPNSPNNNKNYACPPPQSCYLQAPVPKQRKSLIKQGNAALYDPSPNDEPPWIIIPNEHKLPRVPVPTNEPHQRQSVIENMRNNLSNSTTNLSMTSNNAKSSRHSRVSSCNSRSEINNSIPWFRWFASRLEKEGEAKGKGRNNKNNQGAKNKSDNSSNANCIRCNKTLPISTKGFKGVINAPVACSVCSLKVCKSCAVWDQSKNSYSCGHCHPPKSIDKSKNFWFDNISPGSGTNFTSAERDKATEDVREHLERIIESQVDEGIDSVSLSRLYDHSQYDVIFHRFHEELSDALMNLGFSLKLAIENKPMNVNETPTSAHTTLTELLSDIKEAAMELPILELINKTESSTVITSNQNNNSAKDAQQPSYEDVLATAVINKAILNGQKLRRKVDSPMSLVDSAVQTDSEMSESSEVHSHKNQYNVRGWVTNLEKSTSQQHTNLSDDDLSMGTSSSNWSNEGNMKGNQQVVIEEQVEEITTTYESDSDMSRHPPVRNRKGRKTARQRNNELTTINTTTATDDTLNGVDLVNFDSRVPFPEGGVDIVPRSKIDSGDPDGNEFDDDPTGILVASISEWEQNWLFKRRKQLLRKRNLMAEAVPMLVPNPNDDGIEPQIGGEKISDLSDLSDHGNEDEEQDDDDLIVSSSEESEPEVNEAASKAEIKTDVNTEVKLPSNTTTPSRKSSNTDSSNEMRRTSDASSSVTNTPRQSLVPETSNEKVVAKSTPKKAIRTKKVEKVVESIKLINKPSDMEVEAGKTARFICLVSEDSPDFSVAWFFDSQLMTTKEGKTWVYSPERIRKNQHYLYIYDVNEKDSGIYHISLFDYKGNETKYSYKLSVTASHRNKPSSPNFTLLKDTVRANKNESVVKIPFEVLGYPEPVLRIYRNEVDISKLSHVFLEDEGKGKWTCELRKNDTDFSVDGEYVAEAKNSKGVTRVTFTIQEVDDGGSKVTSSVPVQEEIITKQVVPKRNNAFKELNGHHLDSQIDKSPSPVPRPVSEASETSSIGETLRETSHTLNRNQTMIKEDYEADLLDHSRNVDPSKMTVAEKEKMKWAHPINLPNNPYAPENLAKRIRQQESSGFKLPPSVSGGELSVTSSDDERGPMVDRKQNMTKFARDYYVHGVTNQPTNKLKTADGPNFGSSRSLSLTSNSSREGSNEKDAVVTKSLQPKQTSAYRTPAAADRTNVPLKSSEVTNYGTPKAKELPKKVSVPIKESNNSNESTKIQASPQEIAPATVSKSNGTSLQLSSVNKDGRSPSPRTRRHNSDLGSVTRDGADLNQIKLPSVRNLAKQFQVPEEKEVPEIKPSNGHVAKVYERKEQPKSYQQVHSLTARSVSRQFREGLKQAQHHPPDINIKLKAQTTNSNGTAGNKATAPIEESEPNHSNNNNTNGIEKSSFNNNNNNVNGGTRNVEDESKPGELSRKKSGSNSNILARAAFWDKRVQDGIVVDDLVISEFPKMEVQNF